MKQFVFVAAAALALGVTAPTLSAQAFSNPTGYVTETLEAGQFNLIGLTVHQPVDVAGTFDSVSGTTLTKAGAFSGLTSGATYILEVTSGSVSGLVQEITVWTNDTLTTVQDLDALGLSSTDTFVLRRSSTINDLFSSDNSAVGLLEGTSASADLLFLPDGSGGFDQYFYSDGTQFLLDEGWRLVGGDNSDQSNAPIPYLDSFFIQRKGTTDIDLVISGAVKTNPTTIAITDNFNFVGGVYPVGSTLESSTLDSVVQRGTSTSADVVWVPTGSGAFDQYFYSDGTQFLLDEGWRLVGGDNSDQKDVVISGGLIIQRRAAAPYNVTIPVPSTWSL